MLSQGVENCREHSSLESAKGAFDLALGHEASVEANAIRWFSDDFYEVAFVLCRECGGHVLFKRFKASGRIIFSTLSWKNFKEQDQ